MKNERASAKSDNLDDATVTDEGQVIRPVDESMDLNDETEGDIEESDEDDEDDEDDDDRAGVL